MNKRSLLTTGVAAVAGALGAGWAWWKFQPHAPADGAAALWWAQQFETPDGAPLAVAPWRGKPLLVNFWATWCPPCVEELPLLNAFHRDQAAAGWRVLGLAVDQPSAVRRFTEKLPLAFPVGMAGLAGTDLSRTLGNTSGGLPFTVVFGRDGRVVERKIGKVSPEDLARWAATHKA